MKIIYSTDTQHILRILRGEEVVAEILSFCKEQNINAGWVSGLGACDKTEISYYDLQKKEYIKTVIEEECELLNLTGNIAFADGKRMLHAHVTLSKSDYSTIGGHLHSMQISGTGEIHITKLEGKFERELDAETGLKLLK
ncbi:MAG TPA: DNA-binding protein [Candidatus Levybacteria bacterium]|nr:DNA-binding protein [Candidatus Levybacteria bacterium]